MPFLQEDEERQQGIRLAQLLQKQALHQQPRGMYAYIFGNCESSCSNRQTR